MKKIKLIAPVAASALVVSATPLVSLASCGSKEVEPNNISFDGTDADKSKTITDDAKVTQTYSFNLDRDITKEEQIVCKTTKVEAHLADTETLIKASVSVVSVTYPEKNKVQVTLLPTVEIEEEKFLEVGDNLTFNLHFTCNNGTTKVIDTSIDNFTISYNVNHESVIPFSCLIIQDGVFKGVDIASLEEKYTTLLIPNNVVEIENFSCRNLPEGIKTVLFEEGTNPLFIKQYGLDSMHNVKTLMLPNRLAYAENNAFTDCPQLETLDLSTWTISRTSPFSDKYMFVGCPKVGKVIYSPGVAQDIYFILKAAGLPDGWLKDFTLPEIVSDYQTNFIIASVKETNDTYICGVIDPTAFKGTTLTIPAYFTKIAPGAFSSVFDNVTYYGSIRQINFAQGSNMSRIYGDSFSRNDKINKIDLSNCELMETIDSGTFNSCGFGLSEVVLPPQIKTIGPNAFAGCEGLSKINLDATQVEVIQPGAFNRCSSLQLSLPDTLKWIGASSFLGTGLKNISIPWSVEYIGYNAFYHCEQATTLEFPFKEETVSNLSYIGQQAFEGCINVASKVTLPQTLRYIGDGAFSNMPSLTGLVIASDGITHNVRYKSANNMILEIIDYEQNEAEIKECSIHTATSSAKLEGLDQVVDPNVVTSIHPYAFAGAHLNSTAFKSVNADIDLSSFANMSSIGYGAFMGTEIDDAGTKTWELKLPTSIRTVGDSAFKNSTIKGIVNTAEEFQYPVSLGKNVFSFCRSLESATIPDGILIIPEAAFEYCSSIKKLTIVANDPNIVFGDHCFYFCSGVEELDLSSFTQVPTSVGSNAFLMFGKPVGNIKYNNATHPEDWKQLFSKMGWNVPEAWTWEVQ